MSTAIANDDGFTAVSSKKNKLRLVKTHRKGKQVLTYVEKTLSEKVERRRASLIEARILQRFTELLEEFSLIPSTSTCPSPLSLVCLGLGSLNDSAAAQSQFLVLEHIRSLITSDPSPKIYDPVHTEQERTFLTELKYQPLAEECDLKLTEPTLLYMPYCPLSLYDDLLRVNWSLEGLSRIVLLGNRLEMYDDPVHPRFVSSSEQKKGAFVAKAASLFETRHLDSKGEEPTSNLTRDQALQWIPRSRLKELDEAFWDFATSLEDGLEGDKSKAQTE